MRIPRDFMFNRPARVEVSFSEVTITFECPDCKTPVTTISRVKKRCDVCQRRANKDAARRSAKRQTARAKKERDARTRMDA